MNETFIERAISKHETETEQLIKHFRKKIFATNGFFFSKEKGDEKYNNR